MTRLDHSCINHQVQQCSSRISVLRIRSNTAVLLAAIEGHRALALRPTLLPPSQPLTSSVWLRQASCRCAWGWPGPKGHPTRLQVPRTSGPELEPPAGPARGLEPAKGFPFSAAAAPSQPQVAPNPQVAPSCFPSESEPRRFPWPSPRNARTGQTGSGLAAALFQVNNR